MKRIIGLTCVFVLVLVSSALAFNQADVNRLKNGDTNMQGADLTGLNLQKNVRREFKSINFSGANFDTASLTSCKFINCTFDNATVRNAVMINTWIMSGTVRNVDFRGTNMDNAKFKGSVVSDCNFSGNATPIMGFSGVTVTNCDFSGINTTAQTLYNSASTAGFTGEFINCNFDNANLTKAVFGRSTLTRVNLNNAVINSGTKFVECKIHVSNKNKLASSGAYLQDNEWIGAGGVNIKNTAPVKKYAPAKPKVNKNMVPIQQ